MVARDEAGGAPFGAIDQQVVRAPGSDDRAEKT